MATALRPGGYGNKIKEMRVVSQWEYFALMTRLLGKTFAYFFSREKNPVKVFSKALSLALPRAGEPKLGPLRKTLLIDGRYYWNMQIPGFPSPAFESVFSKEIGRGTGSAESPLAIAVVAVTKKCSLQCAHCFEGDAINQKEELSLGDLKRIVADLLSERVGYILFSGGEPLNRYRDLLSLLRHYKDSPVDFWINTSGHGLSQERSTALREAGLRGVVVSLDHFIPELHDRIRGRIGAFEEAVMALEHANQSGLVCALSLCPSDEIAASAHFRQYLALARRLGAAFVQIIEPQLAGRNQTGAISLSDAGRQSLEALCVQYAAAGYPIISYPDAFKRKYGCVGGKRYVYYDTQGVRRACPFCKNTCYDGIVPSPKFSPFS
jgi:MoaA/NifB/PqqE/SkfB family radical SAM enzyme